MNPKNNQVSTVPYGHFQDFLCRPSGLHDANGFFAEVHSVRCKVIQLLPHSFNIFVASEAVQQNESGAVLVCEGNCKGSGRERFEAKVSGIEYAI